MGLAKVHSSRRSQWVYFTLAMVVIVLLYGAYGINMVKWRNSPDFGWRFIYDTGPNYVSQVFGAGEAAGLRVGDEILAINGRAYTTFDELFFGGIRNDEPGSVNMYTVQRDGATMEIGVTTGRLGLKAVLWRSGTLLAIGLVFVLIGILVFLMKPQAPESWLFLVMACVIGTYISYASPSDLFSPFWLYNVRHLIMVTIPAPMIWLALRFPRARFFVLKQPWLWIVPYLFSLTLFVLYRISIDYIWEPAPVLDMIFIPYFASGLLAFVILLVWNLLKDTSILVRLQSKAILLGMVLGLGIPLTDSLTRYFWQVTFFPDPTWGYTLTLGIFPLAIGYTIVKHDLFAIDTIIKRTYGYVLTTGTIAGVYGLFVLVSNLAFGRFEVTKSPVFPLIFVLAVVFLFNPIRNRAQRFIDRVFYRLEYDYQETVQKISETMRSLLKLDEILEAVMDIAMGSMFIDSGCVMLLNRNREAYECLAVAGKREERRDNNEPASALPFEEKPEKDQLEQPPGATEGEADTEGRGKEENHPSELRFAADEPLIQKVAERKKPVTIYDIEADPFFEGERDSCSTAFDRMQGTLIVPLIYEDRLTGLMSLGQKKSGKFYRREDINLLNTLANQGAVAIENAMLVEEVIEKERMEEELSIARDLQMSMLPASCPEIAGFEIAALSTPAKEVGGDFFDFIEMEEGKLGLVIADVTGKSVSGALVMSSSRSVFRMLSEEELTVGEIMGRANRRIKKDIKSGMFVALLYAVLDAKDKVLSLCSAGQTQPVLISAETGEASLVETQGDTFPLGILDDADYQETKIQLTPGDRVVFYTDGIVETMNEKEEMFGFESLLEVARKERDKPAESLLEEIIEQVNEFAGGAAQHDDLTVIVVSVGK